MTSQKKPLATEKVCLIHAKDLPLCCPMQDRELWNAHPRVYLPIEESGQETCPYCGTMYILQQDDEIHLPS